MIYQVIEDKFQDNTAKTAWSKARTDAEEICRSLHFEEIRVRPAREDRANLGKLQKLSANLEMGKIWSESLAKAGQGDILFLQIPMIHNCFYISSILKKVRSRGVKIIALTHDLELLRLSLIPEASGITKYRIRREEMGVLSCCDQVIVHNKRMRKYLADLGVPDHKMITLGIFDYLMDEGTRKEVEHRPVAENFRNVIIAGNLSPDKAGYLYDFPDDLLCNLYGVNYRDTGKENCHYFGSFEPEVLPARLEGGFGLVWDGTTSETCDGIYGKYLKYNNPHKTSLYLASGIPVVIWKKAALAKFVQEKKVGICVESLREAADRIQNLTVEEYRQMSENAKQLGVKLREGEFLLDAIHKGMEALNHAQ